MRKATVWTEENRAMLAELYHSKTNAELAEIFGVTERAIGAQAFVMHLRKPKSFVIEHARKSWFKKGSVPANKGKKMPPDVYAKCSATMFKKGQLPHNTKYDGHESVRMEKSGRRYVHVRVALGKYVMKHVLEWEKANGPVPEGMILRCRSDDTLDCRPENWYPVTRSEHARLNKQKSDVNKISLSMSLYHHPELKEVFDEHPELAELKVLSNQLKREIHGKIRKRKKRKGDAP